MCIFFFVATLRCCSYRRKSLGPSAPIAYATYVSPTDEAVAWPWCRYPISDKAAAWPGHRGLVLDMAATWPGMEFEQITEHGCES